MSGESEAQRVSVPLDVLNKLLPMAEQMGLNIPGMTRFAPLVDLTQPISALALEIGRLVARHNIFLKPNRTVVTVEPETGEEEAMTSLRLPDYLEQWATFHAPGARQKRDSLTAEDAGQILRTDTFRSCLRPLNGVNKMRLPVLRSGELWNVEFLPAGYDQATGIFTVETLKYEMDWPIDKATDFLNSHGVAYPLVWETPEGQRDLFQNRSWSVQVAAMVGVYCRALFEPGTPRPMILIVGNKPGTGKSTLVAMILSAIYGTASATNIPKDEDRMISTLETAARSRRPYLFFDDVPFGLFNNALYEFILAPSHSARKMGNNEEFFEEPNMTQVFATGNDIKFDDNLKRRALIIDLFLETEVRGRKFDRFINAPYLAKRATRANFLAAMCAIVRNYIEMRPMMSPEQLALVRPLESFEDWSEMIAYMVMLAGYCDPLAQPDLAGSGSEDDDEMKELLLALATDADEDCVFTRAEMVDEARRRKLLEGLVGLEGDPAPDSKVNKKWGRRLQKYRGQRFVDGKNRRFQFSHRKQKTGAHYPLTFIKDGRDAVGPQQTTP